MYIHISPSEKGDNRGSSVVLVNYLEKESRLYPDRNEPWFNGRNRDIASYQIRAALDGNVAKLCQKDAKFFLLNISPSQREIAFLLKTFGEEGARNALKAYTVKVMDSYDWRY
ncbi:MAG: hypothetical protein JNL13_01335 [Chitinophagaceae bacterium]|nr:hypothetical protein [Chitinophagaceae bacterium]